MPVSGSDHSRVKIFVLAMIVWQVAVLGRVFYLKVFKGEFYQQRAKSQKEDVVDVTAPRGRILDCNLEPLAVSIPYDSLYAYVPNVEDREKTATSLSRVLAMDRGEILEKLSGNPKFRYIKRFITPEERDNVIALKLQGLGFIRETKRVYPNQSLAAHVIGAVSFSNGVEIGLEGIERQYDKALTGAGGRMFIMRDGMSNILTTSMIKPAVPGQDLVLTLDSELQFIVQKELDAGMQAYHAKAGMVVVMDPHDGRVLAMASSPGFDPNKLKKEDMPNLRNQAIESYFEPGSTFKIVTTSGAIEEKVTNTTEMIHCGNGSISINGHLIRDHHAFGSLSLPEILANSSDVGCIKLGMRLGNERMYSYIRKFGFGEKTGIDLPSEIPGFVANPKRWSGISIGAISMGQEVGVTALQVARAMSVVANGGYKVRPFVVDRVLDDQGKLIQSSEPSRCLVLKPSNAAVIRDALCSVVEAGTGKKAAIPGFRVAGKTGTAQKFDRVRGCYSPTEFVASFVGFAPAENPAFVMAVIFDAPTPYHGGEAAAPVFSAIGKQILVRMRIKPTNPIPEHPEAPVLKEDKEKQQVDFVDFMTQTGPAETGLPKAEPLDTKKVYYTVATVEAPDLRGKSLRSAAAECSSAGLLLRASGSGVAVSQNPLPGTRVVVGSPCCVSFSPLAVVAAKAEEKKAAAPAASPRNKAAVSSGKKKNADAAVARKVAVNVRQR